MINTYYAKKFCAEDISLIENYSEAAADLTTIWDCHHRREISEHLSRKELIAGNQYFGVPASELIFLTHSEHRRLHSLGKHPSTETRAKISAANKGENHPFFGKRHSAETRAKMSVAKLGKPKSAETRAKMSAAKKGMRFFNNGQICVMAKTCPEGFVPGMLKKKTSS